MSPSLWYAAINAAHARRGYIYHAVDIEKIYGNLEQFQDLFQFVAAWRRRWKGG